MLDIHDSQHAFYNATFGRWLYNQKQRLEERHLYFDVDRLSVIVAETVGQTPNDILHFTKIAEGGSYRVFDILFKDQRNVIVRLPYPCTNPGGYGVASEVATIEYLRLKGLPIPRVLSWSSTTSNSLGCEYIIMDKAQGKALEEIWYTMNREKRKLLVEKIVDIETVLFKIQLPANGSIYFKDSFPQDAKTVDLPDDNRFCIGPSTEIWWWYHRRDELQVGRGPWTSTLDMLTAIGQRELEWLQKFGKPRYPREPLYRELYGKKRVDPQGQIVNLQNYLKIAPYIVPAREDWNRPTIRHPDLSPSNIFIDEAGDNITSVIDWERTVVCPMFMQARVPAHFQNFGDEASESFQFPALPENFESLSESEKELEMERYRRRQLHYYYLGFTSRANQDLFRAMGTPSHTLRNQTIDAASHPWEGDSTSLKAQLINLSINWPEMNIPSHLLPKPIEFPIKFREAEIKSTLAINEEQKSADAEMQVFRDHFNCNIDGWVPAEIYDEAKRKVDEMKAHMLQIAETEEERQDIDENWPFQDHEEVL
ncbi:hypothetical protein EMCG_01434 [[Emmonsia] crescens]|uniref:Aminoglycoside phosphotransferase domain-containing protein n=1 Tax=[Emmonsia] crescens TaxID=73230 RepID=A0A0G2I2Z3_9EURO|nr:hypothetical protein EMCG_01434 [Emmonsia crescens UAMH 3008]